MSDANGTAGDLAQRMKASRRIIGELGPTCSYADVCERMEVAGLRPVSEPTFYKHRREVHPDAPDGRRNAVVIPDRPPTPPEPKPARDWLTRLVKFGVAVEDVGGVEAARRMLDALGTLEQQFGTARNKGG